MSKELKLLAFDVFGTVVDWRSSVIAEGGQLGAAKGLHVDWAEFADAWRSIYRPYMDRVQSGELPWTKLDDLHRRMLDETLAKLRSPALAPTKRKT
jgi:2-haloacid dehalogenase